MLKANVQKMSNAKIGILSGMGPIAGSDTLHKLLRYSSTEYGAVEDAEYPDITLVSHGIAGFDAQATLSLQVKDELFAAMKQLELSKPTAIGIVCTVAHLYLKQLQMQTRATIINLPKEMARSAAAHPGQKYLLLESYAARVTGLYHAALQDQEVSYMLVTDQEQATVDDAIGLVMACKLLEAGEKLKPLFETYANQITAIIAGCTEIPLALDAISGTFSMSYLDANLVLAKALADSCYSVKSKPRRNS